MRLELERILPGVVVRRGVKGAALTTFAIGGELEALVEAVSPEALCRILRTFSEENISFRVLGAGSNVLVSSAGLSGVTLTLGRSLRTVVDLGSGRFQVGGAAALTTLVRDVCTQGFSGLEFAGGIPGSVGGACFMNAGAHGGQMSDIVTRVRYVTAQGEPVEVDAGQLPCRYRSIGLPENAVIYQVELCLKPADPAEILERRRSFLEERKRRQPLTLPSAGSVFKNPSREHSAGYLIEGAGLKGHRHGGAQISALHANWIVNPERVATDEDVTALMRLCQERVSERFSIMLEPEIRVWR